VPEKLAEVLTKRCRAEGAGTCSPPFRDMGWKPCTNLRREIEAINASGAGCCSWRWRAETGTFMHDHARRLLRAVAWAAFDFHMGAAAGPAWMQTGAGMVPSFLREPRRL